MRYNKGCEDRKPFNHDIDSYIVRIKTNFCRLLCEHSAKKVYIEESKQINWTSNTGKLNFDWFEHSQTCLM